MTEIRRTPGPAKGCPCTDTSRQDSGNCALAVQHTCFTDSCTAEVRMGKRGIIYCWLHSGDERMGGRGANTVLQITYLNSVVMPDEESSSSSDEDDEADDDESAADGVDD